MSFDSSFQARAERQTDKRAAELFVRMLGSISREQRGAIENARPALLRLVGGCRDHSATGQAKKVRALLYSAWNGQETSLLENSQGLDWPVKKDVMAVLLAFGCEPEGESFFYDAVTDAFRAVGMYDWFLAAHNATEQDK